MKYKLTGMCPMCDAERGISTPWGMNPIAMGELRKNHEAGHPENEPKQKSSPFEFCPHCGKDLSGRMANGL